MLDHRMVNITGQNNAMMKMISKGKVNRKINAETSGPIDGNE